MKIGVLWEPDAFAMNAAIHGGKDIIKFTGYNTGNMAYVEGIRHIVGPENVTFYPWWAKEKDLPADLDLLVFPAANQLGNHTDLGGLADLFLGYGKPVVAIGLGAQYKSADEDVVLKDGTRRWLDVLCSLAPKPGVPNIITRGDFTATVLDKLGYSKSYVSAGCPSQFINLDVDLFKKINSTVLSSDLYSLSYNTSDYAWDWAKSLDSTAFAYIQANAGAMLTQAPEGYIELVKTKTLSHLHPKFAALKAFLDVPLEDSEFARLLKKYFFTFSNAQAWRSWLTHYDFNFGTRIHGTMLSIQSELPSFLIVHDTRTKELAEKMGVPHVHVKDLPHNVNLVSYVKEYLRTFNFEFMGEKRKENSIFYRTFLENNGVKTSLAFQQFCKQSEQVDKNVSSTLSLPISGNMMRVVPNSARVFEVYESLPSFSAQRRNTIQYVGFSRSAIMSENAAFFDSLPLIDTVVFSASIVYAKDGLSICESLKWNFRQLVVRCDAVWVEYVKTGNASAVDNGQKEAVNTHDACHFFERLKALGFSLKSPNGHSSVSDEDQNGRVVLSFMR